MKKTNAIHNSSVINLDKLRAWRLPDLQTELMNQETLKAEQEIGEELKAKFFFLLIFLIILAPIALILWQKWNIWFLAPIYFFYLIVFFSLKSKPLKPSEIQAIHVCHRLIDRTHYSPEYYKELKKWEELRLEEEFKKMAENEEKKKLEKIEQDELEEKKRAEERAIRKQLAEAALARGEDVCMDCYTINPSRCHCGHCACYGYCYLCDDGGDDD